MSLRKYKDRYAWARQYEGPFASFVYALNGWMIWLWYAAWAALGWFMLDILEAMQ